MLLLDVNALLALRYDSHVHHRRVHLWVSQLGNATFATCPITELGFVRVSSGKAGYAANVDTARADLVRLKSRMDMRFVPDELTTDHLPSWVRKSLQTTDGYLLALAKFHGASLATLDRFIPDAMFIPEEPSGPIMVRERIHPALASGSSRVIQLRAPAIAR